MSAIGTVVIGSGGHAGMAIKLLNRRCIMIDGLLDDYLPAGTIRHGVEVIGPVNKLNELPTTLWFVAVGDNQGRRDIVNRLSENTSLCISVLSMEATIFGKHGRGCFVGPGAVIGTDSYIGDFSIVNTNASLDHDSLLGHFSHLAPGAVTGGRVIIGAHTLVGINACIRDGVTVGDNCIIGMGSVVTEDVPNNSIGWGNPWKLQATR